MGCPRRRVVNDELRLRLAGACRWTRSAAGSGRVPGELRGYLTVVPEARWIKNAEYEEFFLTETIDHYEDHADDLAAILARPVRRR